MEVTYRRELNEAYMILKESGEGEEYALRILQENRLTGLMPLDLRCMDGQTYYWYAISDYRPLERILERRALDYEEMCRILRNIHRTLAEMEEYLLPAEHLILDPAFLYLKDGSMLLCCHPAWEKDFYEQMRKLMQFLINKMDHQNPKQVELAYQIFQVTEKEFFRMEEMLEIMDIGPCQEEIPEHVEVSERKQNSSKPVKQADSRQPVRRPNPVPGKKNAAKKKTSDYQKGRWVRILGILLQGLGAVIGILAGYIRYRVGFLDPYMVAAAAGLLALGMLLRRRFAGETVEAETDPSVSVPEEGGGTALLTGSFPGRGTPILVSENLMEQENIPMEKMPFTLGKQAGSDGVLSWPTVSREHAKVEYRMGQYYLEDCHSTNGTFLNGKVLEPEQWYPLCSGDEVGLADRKFIFQSVSGLT